MNNKLLLITCITLLYRQSQLNSGNVVVAEKSSDLVRDILERIKLPEMQVGIDHERDVLEGLKSTALMMCNDPATHCYEVSEIMQQLRMNTSDDTVSYEALRDGIEFEMDERTLQRTCGNLLRKLREHFAYEKSQEILQKAAYTAKFEKTKITDWAKFLREFTTEIEPYTFGVAEAKDPAIIAEVDLDNLADVAHVYKSIQVEEAGESIMRTGWQGLNRMLQGGLRRGDEVCVTALQHNFKTGFTLNLFKHIALYNTPYMLDPSKKPLLLRFSFEDRIENNFEFLYKSIYENETGNKADMRGLTPEYIAQYVRDKLRVNGYHVKMIRVDPTKWTYRDICNKIIEFESMGYEIHALILDYLAMIPTTGCTIGPAGHDIRDMFRRMRNFCNPRKITLITPHQFSTDAKRLLRLNQTGFVKEMAGKGYYAGCQSLDNELDLEIHIHIEKMNGRSYLTVQRGKHRVNEILPEKDMHMVLPFHDIGGVRDDIDKPETTLSRVGGGVRGSGEEVPFWEEAMD